MKKLLSQIRPVPNQIRLVTDDPTKESEAIKRLDESERRYRELSESTHDLVCSHDLQGRITDVNVAAARSLGYTREELCGMNLRDVLTDAAPEPFDTYLATVAREGAAEGLMSINARNGDQLLWEYQNTLQSANGGSTVRGLARDVTERERALSELRKNERHFRSIIENVCDLITIVDVAGTIEYAAPSVDRALGYSPDRVLGGQFVDLVDSADAGAVAKLFASQLAAPDTVGSLDARLLHRDGTVRWFSIIATNRLTGDVVTSMILNARDITERRQLVAQLAQAGRVDSLGRLAATLAHEFNNVLMGILPFAELMQRPAVTRAGVAKAAGYIVNSIARGKRVALDILRFTRPCQPALLPLQLRGLWEELLPGIQAVTANAVAIDWDVPAALNILADTGQVSQIFANLVSNARDAMPGGGELRVTARTPLPHETFSFGFLPSPEDFVQISVADRGCGIDPAILPNVFDPLFTTKENSGTGLGLAVVHQIVTNHGGSVFVESQLGVGTTFHVFLPATRAEAAAQPAAAGPATDLSSLRVLIIDDEEAVSEGLSEVLRDDGLRTATAATGAAGEAEARRFRPHVAVVDERLADCSGTDVANRLLRLDPALRIVMMSGHADGRRIPLSEGRTAFLQKPFDVTELLEVIDALIPEELRR